MRVGLGPVFAYERLIAARRWHGYALRSLFVMLLLASLGVVWWSEVKDKSVSSIRAQARVGMSFANALVGTQLVLVLLAAPAATAGAVCLDRARGTLLHLLVTDLSDAEVVLGKLGARAAPALGLVACALPVATLSTLLGGVDPRMLLAAFLVTVGVTVLGCALALTFSVWGTKTHEVLLATYLAIGLWLLVVPGWWMVRLVGGSGLAPPDWLAWTNPFVVAMAHPPGAVDLVPPVLFLAACLAASALLVLVAIRFVRRVAVRGERPGKVRPRVGRRRWGRWLAPFRPALDANPVLWREWHRSRPSWWARAVWLGYVATSIGFTALSLWTFADASSGRMAREMCAVMVNGLQVAVGLLLLSVGAATALAEERVRGSLDVLLATPMPTRSIVAGKWWGTFRAVPPLAILPALVVAAAAARPGGGRWLAVPVMVALILAYGAAITSLGLALATWVARVGRAVGVAVALYVAVAGGWFILIAMTVHSSETGPGLASASPFLGAAYVSVAVAEVGGRDMFPNMLGWETFWIIFYGLLAAGLYLATLRTFEGRLGRMPEDARHLGPRRPPAAKPEPKPAEWAAAAEV